MIDEQKLRLYGLESAFWGRWNTHAYGMIDVMERKDWEAYCELLLADGIKHPYQVQRRRTRSRPLSFATIMDSEDLQGFALQSKDYLGAKAGARMKYIAMHEVVHLLTRELTQNAHNWRFVSIYSQMIGRHVSEEAAGMFRSLAHALNVQFTEYSDRVRFA